MKEQSNSLGIELDWIELMIESKQSAQVGWGDLLDESTQLLRIFVASGKTARNTSVDLRSRIAKCEK